MLGRRAARSRCRRSPGPPGLTSSDADLVVLVVGQVAGDVQLERRRRRGRRSRPAPRACRSRMPSLDSSCQSIVARSGVTGGSSVDGGSVVSADRSVVGRRRRRRRRCRRSARSRVARSSRPLGVGPVGGHAGVEPHAAAVSDERADERAEPRGHLAMARCVRDTSCRVGFVASTHADGSATRCARGIRRPSRAPASRAVTLRRIWCVRPAVPRGRSPCSCVAILAAALLALVPPLVVRAILDTAIPRRRPGDDHWLAALAVARRARRRRRCRSCSAGAAPASARG